MLVWLDRCLALSTVSKGFAGLSFAGLVAGGISPFSSTDTQDGTAFFKRSELCQHNDEQSDAWYEEKLKRQHTLRV